jgi:hypothetical protein
MQRSASQIAWPAPCRLRHGWPPAGCFWCMSFCCRSQRRAARPAGTIRLPVRVNGARFGAWAVGRAADPPGADPPIAPHPGRSVAWGCAGCAPRLPAGACPAASWAGADGMGARGSARVDVGASGRAAAPVPAALAARSGAWAFARPANRACALVLRAPPAARSGARGSASACAPPLIGACRGAPGAATGRIGAWASDRAATVAAGDAAEPGAAAPACSGARGPAGGPAIAPDAAARAAAAARRACRASAMACFHGAREAVSACSMARSSALVMPHVGRGGTSNSGAIGFMRAASSGGSRR